VSVRLIPALTLALLVALSGAPASTAQLAPAAVERVDLDAIYRIKDEGLQRSQVMDTAWYLTEVHGPRLTNSPGMHAAADWAIERLKGWGFADARRETWGEFGRGWTNDRFAASVIAPTPSLLVGYPRAWTPGTNGVVAGDVVLAVIEREEDFKKFEGRLKGRIVLAQNAADVRLLTTPLARRYTDEELKNLESQPVTPPAATAPSSPPAPPTAQQRMQFFFREGVLAVLEPGTGRNDHGAFVVQGPRENRNAKEPPVPPQVALATEHYNRLVRLVRRDIPVRVQLDIANRFLDDSRDAYNIVAELPGADRTGEVVMLGAHFDSWHTGTGATDNAAGVAAMMEAMRILKTAGVRLRRTVRLALWTGEEQGLLGSRAYVKQHFGDRDTMALRPAHATLSAYFNLDNGSGAIRGVYLQGNESVRPVFASWMEPLRSLGMTTLSIRNTGSTDHVPFDEIGLPGFQFIQDPLEYSTHSHHTNMDLYDRLQADDLMKNATIVAAFAYHAANRDDLLPRKPLPKARTDGNPTTTTP
jgi:carboxypeptidase Q